MTQANILIYTTTPPESHGRLIPASSNFMLTYRGIGAIVSAIFQRSSTIATAESTGYAASVSASDEEVSLSSQKWFWTEEWQRMEAEADADIAAGRVSRFDDIDSFLADLEV